MSLPEATRFEVNGRACAVQAEADTPLLYVLRNDLGLKGAKFGCGLGQCGACTVLLDGHAINACDTPLWSVAGKKVTTVEGLADGDRISVLQQAFVDEQAVQCGYCISGMLMAASALLAANPQPSLEQIKAAMDRNLCRCGTQARILRAVQRASRALADRSVA
jgi:nicotinate dehydrogenase subunit A